jgi:ABC transporter substrate binding protein
MTVSWRRSGAPGARAPRDHIDLVAGAGPRSMLDPQSAIRTELGLWRVSMPAGRANPWQSRALLAAKFAATGHFRAAFWAVHGQKADIIAVTTTPDAHAVKKATSTIPIVMVALGDPAGTGLVDSLAGWVVSLARIELPVLLLRCPHLGSSHSRGSADFKRSWRAGRNERIPQALMKPWHRMTSAF